MQSPVAIILAGGANRRFWPLQQKSLLRFGDQTLLDRHVGALAAAGFADVVVVANPANEAQMRALAAGAPARLHVVVQPEPLGMGDAVLQCGPLLTGPLKDRPILITQTHDLVEPSLFATLIDRLTADDADGFVVGVKLASYFPGGYLVVRDGRAVDVIEKPPPGSEPSDLMKIVDDLIRRPTDLLRALGEVDPHPSDHYERALGRLMEGGTIRVVDYPGPWVPIKYPWDVLRAAELFLGNLPNEVRRGEGVFVHPSATVSGPVWLGDRVRIFAGAAVLGPAIVGSGTLVGNGALIRASIVGRDCIVGFATEVARSYLGDGCELHTNYVGDSVLGEDVAFGSGTVTANLRHDERNAILPVDGQPVDTGMSKLGALIGSRVRVGINVSLRDGVRIGSNCAIGPGLWLDRDLADNQFVKLKQELEVRPNRLTIDRASRAKFHKAL
jgi:UDP-N-acetylglucosamine diphosphorylase / glucose-1-phosphate thymidylyltransferase / UDP-N-acetylgalactosamine diphosphorylase / glucosamine-1-phosphate N-acetyltransferase / galactosamine-1-phosphate N-acetyltransferase